MKLTATFIVATFVSASAAMAESTAPIDVDFDDYGAVAASLTGVPGDPENGAKMMNKGKGNCIACHETPSLAQWAFHGEIGPMLEYPADVYSEAELRGIVIDAKHTFEGTMMPSFYKDRGYIRPGIGFTKKPATEPLPPILTAQEIEDVVAYLLTLKE